MSVSSFATFMTDSSADAIIPRTNSAGMTVPHSGLHRSLSAGSHRRMRPVSVQSVTESELWSDTDDELVEGSLYGADIPFIILSSANNSSFRIISPTILPSSVLSGALETANRKRSWQPPRDSDGAHKQVRCCHRNGRPGLVCKCSSARETRVIRFNYVSFPYLVVRICRKRSISSHTEPGGQLSSSFPHNFCDDHSLVNSLYS